MNFPLHSLATGFILFMLGFVVPCETKDFQQYGLDRVRRARAAAEGATTSQEQDCDISTYRYYSNETARECLVMSVIFWLIIIAYLISSMPDINYHLGEMYGGLIPINKSDPSRQLYHIFKPAIDGPQDEITIYLNGGPGCSSLDSFLQETGPYLWQPGTFLPVPNPYSWANITNMLWVDQPVGTGFSIGKVTATSEYDIAAEFVEWFKNFELLYGITHYKICSPYPHLQL